MQASLITLQVYDWEAIKFYGKQTLCIDQVNVTIQKRFW